MNHGYATHTPTGQQYDATGRLIHVQTWLAKEAAGVELAHRGLEATARARALFDAKGLPWRLHVAMGEPAERILEHAARLGELQGAAPVAHSCTDRVMKISHQSAPTAFVQPERILK